MFRILGLLHFLVCVRLQGHRSRSTVNRTAYSDAPTEWSSRIAIGPVTYTGPSPTWHTAKPVRVPTSYLVHSALNFASGRDLGVICSRQTLVVGGGVYCSLSRKSGIYYCLIVVFRYSYTVSSHMSNESYIS